MIERNLGSSQTLFLFSLRASPSVSLCFAYSFLTPSLRSGTILTYVSDSLRFITSSLGRGRSLDLFCCLISLLSILLSHYAYGSVAALHFLGVLISWLLLLVVRASQLVVVSLGLRPHSSFTVVILRFAPYYSLKIKSEGEARATEMRSISALLRSSRGLYLRSKCSAIASQLPLFSLQNATRFTSKYTANAEHLPSK